MCSAGYNETTGNIIGHSCTVCTPKAQSLATDMRRLFYSTWPPSFSSHIKKELLSNRGGERRWPQNKTGVVHRYQANRRGERRWPQNKTGVVHRYQATVPQGRSKLIWASASCLGHLVSLRCRHNGNDSVSNHQPYDCLLKRLFRRRWKKISKLCVTGLCARNSPGTGEFPVQMASNSENVSIGWRHHVKWRSSVWIAMTKSAAVYDIFSFCTLGLPCQVNTTHKDTSNFSDRHRKRIFITIVRYKIYPERKKITGMNSLPLPHTSETRLFVQ